MRKNFKTDRDLNRELKVSVDKTSLRTFYLCLIGVILSVSGCAFQVPKYPSKLPPLVPLDANQSVYPLLGYMGYSPLYYAGYCRNGMCPSIAGHYSDKGFINGNPKTKASLTQLLYGGDPCYAQADSVVVIEDVTQVQTVEEKTSKELQQIVSQSIRDGTGQMKMQHYQQECSFISEIQSLKNGQRFANWRYNQGGKFRPGMGSVVQEGAPPPDPLLFNTVNKDQARQLSGLLIIKRNEKSDVSPIPILFFMFVNWDALCMGKAVDGSLIVFHSKGTGGFIGLIPFRFSDDTWYRFPPVEKGK